MVVKSWSNGNGTFGIRVGNPNRKRHFKTSWKAIEVEIEGNCYRFALTPGFWKGCPEFRDSGATVIHDWLDRHGKLRWTAGDPHEFQLLHLGGRRFRLELDGAAPARNSRTSRAGTTPDA